jgi:hypothetical protein
METSKERALDAQSAAGGLAQIFVLDVTTATGVCAGCGHTGPFAQLHLYGGAVGTVIRCPDCDNVLMRTVTTPQGTWLEMQGLRHLTFATA